MEENNQYIPHPVAATGYLTASKRVMEPLSLNLSLTQNRALNHDGITALRSLSLTQEQTYGVSLNFFSGATQVSPAVDNFAFFIRSNGGSDVVSVNSGTVSGSGYYFSLPVTSPYLSTTASYKGYFSFNTNGSPTIIDPFAINVAATTGNGTSLSYVTSANGLSNAVTFSGSGNVSVSTVGQSIVIYGSGGGGATGDYYSNSNPSGYITSSALAPYATNAALAATGSGLQASLATLQSQSGGWYSKTNPSGFINAIPSDVVRTTGDQSIAGTKTFAENVNFNQSVAFNNNIFCYGNLQTDAIIDNEGNGYEVDIADGKLIDNGTTVLTWPSKALAGSWTHTATPTATGHITNKAYVDTFYPRANPSGYLTATGNGGSLANVVHTSGNQTVSGIKTFNDSVIFNDVVKVNTLRDTGGNGTISLAGIGYVASEPFTTSVTLTKVVPTSPAVATLQSTWDSASDGDTITIAIDGSYVTFEFDNDSNLNNPSNVEVLLAGGNTENDLVNAINTAFSGVATATATDSENITITTTNAGSAESITISSITASNPINSTNGTGSVESGTRQATVWGSQSPRKTYVTQVSAYVPSTNWSNADIEIGYWDGGTFTRIALLPLASITAGIHHLFADIQIPDSTALQNFYQGMSVDLVARTAISGSPGDETTGDDVTLYFRGYTSNT